MVIANWARRLLLAICHLTSNKRLRNNCFLKPLRWPKYSVNFVDANFRARSIDRIQE